MPTSPRKRILLTGGSGFVGRHLLERYGDRYRFFAPTHQQLDLTDAVAVARFVEQYPVDLIVHTANIGGDAKTRNLQNIVEVNLRMFFSIAQLAPRVARIIFLGSGAEYGKQADLIRVQEAQFGARVPSDSYGFYKYACSRFIETVDNIVNLRIFGLYGRYEDADIRFISKAILTGIRGESLTVYQNVRFEYMYITDFIAIVGHFIEHAPQEKFYNMGVDDPVDLLTIVREVEEVVGKKVAVSVAKPGMANEYTCDNALLRRDLPELRFTDRRAAMAELYRWYKNQT